MNRFAYCFCPSYRKFPCLQTAIYLFVKQKYENKRMYVLEDSGRVAHDRGDDFIILSSEKRFPSLPSKYNHLIEILKPVLNPEDAILVWDDDDIYLEDYISTHMEILKDYPVSIPSKHWIYYDSKLELIPTQVGHFSLAFRVECLEKVPGWIETKRMDHDQLFISELKKHFEVGDPTTIAPPQVIYRWTSPCYHSSAFSVSPEDELWYDRIEVFTPKGKFIRLRPEPDKDAWKLIEEVRELNKNIQK